MEGKNHSLRCLQLELETSSNELGKIQSSLIEKEQEIQSLKKISAATQLSLENLDKRNTNLERNSKQTIDEMKADMNNLKQMKETEIKATEAKHAAQIEELNKNWEATCGEQMLKAIEKERYRHMEELEAMRSRISEEGRNRETLAIDALSQQNEQRVRELTDGMEQLRREHLMSLAECQKEFEKEKVAIMESYQTDMRKANDELMETSKSREDQIRCHLPVHFFKCLYGWNGLTYVRPLGKSFLNCCVDSEYTGRKWRKL